jgi:hypothetical protein
LVIAAACAFGIPSRPVSANALIDAFIIGFFLHDRRLDFDFAIIGFLVPESFAGFFDF